MPSFLTPADQSPATDLSNNRPGRRGFLGLSGALGLALTGAVAGPASALATPAATGGLVGSCAGGRDPLEVSSSPARLNRLAVAAQDAAEAPVAAAAPTLTRSRTRSARCKFLTRAAWGADESIRFNAAGAEIWPGTYWPVQTITVHHTADGSTDPDPAARVRSIYRNDTVGKGYGDIGYQFLIDSTGTVYEGRYSGADGVPGFNADGLMVNGAHTAGYNAGNVGIALLGDFSSTLPTAATQHALVSLLAKLTQWHGIDPLAKVHYVNPVSGDQADVQSIPGHRDWMATLCPGEQFYPLLAQVRQDVAAR